MQLLADKARPRETGGTFMGYHAKDDVVVTAITGPGPGAVHGRDSFVPDYAYQDAEIARIYAASGRRHTYLGDWHTHPGGGSSLSRKDKRALCAISHHQPARVATPIIGILAGGAPWRLTVWRYVPGQLKKWRLFRRYAEMSVATYRNLRNKSPEGLC